MGQGDHPEKWVYWYETKATRSKILIAMKKARTIKAKEKDYYGIARIDNKTDALAILWVNDSFNNPKA